MWAVDIPHVNCLQFLNVDRPDFQEKLSKRGKTLWKTGEPGGLLPSKQVASCSGGVLPVPPISGWRQLFVGGPTHFSSRTGTREGHSHSHTLAAP